MKAKFDRAYQALEFLLNHHLDPTPLHYELALAHLAGAHPGLSRQIEQLTEDGLRLSAGDAAQLARSHGMPREGQRLEAAEAQVLSHTHRLETLTNETQEITGDFGRDLARMPVAEGSLADLTRQMITRLTQAEHDLAGMASEIVDLRRQIHTRHDDAQSALSPDGAHDMLTETSSRQVGDVLLLSLAAEPHGYTLALSKLDDLHLINNRYGRTVGDNVLRAMASTLRQACEGHELIRWTGDEFLTIFRGVSLHSAHDMIDAARDAMVRRTLRLRGDGTPIGTVTFSAGLAAGRGDDPAEALRRSKGLALNAMASGGNVVLT